MPKTAAVIQPVDVRAETLDSMKAVAHHRGVVKSEKWFREALRQHRMPHAKIGRTRLWSVADFDRMIEAETQRDAERRGKKHKRTAAPTQDDWNATTAMYQAALVGG